MILGWQRTINRTAALPGRPPDAAIGSAYAEPLHRISPCSVESAGWQPCPMTIARVYAYGTLMARAVVLAM